LQHYLEFGDIFGFGRYLSMTLNIFNRCSYPDGSLRAGDFRRQISFVMKSRQLFNIRFFMRFSAMRFSTKVFELAIVSIA